MLLISSSSLLTNFNLNVSPIVSVSILVNPLLNAFPQRHGLAVVSFCREFICSVPISIFWLEIRYNSTCTPGKIKKCTGRLWKFTRLWGGQKIVRNGKNLYSHDTALLRNEVKRNEAKLRTGCVRKESVGRLNNGGRIWYSFASMIKGLSNFAFHGQNTKKEKH